MADSNPTRPGAEALQLMLEEVLTAHPPAFWEVIEGIDHLRVLNGAAPLWRRRPGPTPGPRYPLGPLRALMGSPNLCQVARLTGFHRRQVARWLNDGLTEHQADAAAVAAGFHPASVWPEWWDYADEQLCLTELESLEEAR